MNAIYRFSYSNGGLTSRVMVLKFSTALEARSENLVWENTYFGLKKDQDQLGELGGKLH